MRRGFTTRVLTALVIALGLCKSGFSLPPLKPLPELKPLRKRPAPKKIVAKTKKSYRISATPSLEYIGGSPTQSQRAGLKGSTYFLYGNWTLYSEGFLETDGARAAEARRSQKTSILQELSLEFKYEAFLIRVGRQPVRWSEAWTLPSLDGWTGRRYNRLFFDALSEQLIHPTGTLISLSNDTFTTDFFYSLQPVMDILPAPFPESERTWNTEWGAHGKVRMGAGLDAELVYFDKLDKKLYGTAFYFATDYFVPKLELGQDSKKNRFGIFGLDAFFGKFSILPRITRFSTDGALGTNAHLTVRWDSTSSWAEAQGFRDTTLARFYSLRYGIRLGKGVEWSFFAQRYEGAENTLFGLYQTMTGGSVAGTKLAIAL